jgi:Family of unknown function (DUF6152)
MKAQSRVLLATIQLLPGPAAFSHHSFAPFDLKKDVTVAAVVRELQWTNPHVWIQVSIADDKGVMKEWGIEAGAPGMLKRTGWSSSLLKPGDKVSIVMHPLRSGGPSGSLVSVTLADGRVLGPGGPPPPPPRTQ